MKTETDLRLIHADIISDEPGSSECKQAIKRLTVDLQIQDSNVIRRLLPIIFNEYYGVVKCISEGISRTKRTSLVKPLVKWLLKIADKFADLLAEHADDIMMLCYKLDHDTKMDTLSIQGCEIFIAIVKKAPWIFHDVSKIFHAYKLRLQNLCKRFDNSKTIHFFEVVELMVEKYPDQLNVYFSDLWQMIVAKLHQLVAQESPSFIVPFSNLLSKLKIHSTPNDEQCTLLYAFFKIQIRSTTLPSCSTYEAILPFFTKMMQFFGKHLLEDCELWHGHFCKYMEKKLEIAPVSMDFDYAMKYPIDDFYQNIFSMEVWEIQTAHMQYFSQYLHSCLENQSLKFYDASCILLWSGKLSGKFLTLENTEQFLESLVDFIFYCLRRSAGTHENYLISISIQTVCIITRRNASLFAKYQKLIINIMDSLSSLQDLGGNDHVIYCIQVCLLNIPSTTDQILRAYIYRNMWKHCSLKWPTCSQKQLYSNCDGNTCTGCSYAKFWKKLLDQKFFFKCQINGLLGHSKTDVETIFKAMWNHTIEFVFYLSTSLNFALCKNIDENGDVRISSFSCFFAESSGDVTLHSNVVQLLCSIVDGVPSCVWMEWNHIFLDKMSHLSASNTYISGFCKLVMIGMKLHDKIDNSWVDSDFTRSTLIQFISNCFNHCQVFGGELQLSYAYLILHIPVNWVVSFIDILPSFFETVFELSKSDFQLAVYALSTIRTWMVKIGKEELNPLISTVVPLLVPLVKVQLATEVRLKQIENSKSYAVLREICLLLAYVDSNLLASFNSGFRYHLTIPAKLLNIKLSTNDLSLNLDMGVLLPQLFFLTIHSSDFRERLHSCELLHLICCFMISRGPLVENVEQNNFNALFRRIVSFCLILAHDDQPMIRQIFNPFMIQCTNLFSCKLSTKELSKAFTESLLEFMMQPRSEVCLEHCCGYLRNLFRSGNTDSDRMCQINLDVIVSSASQNVLHPCLARRKGAALALLSIRQPLFTETWSYDKYCLYMIYYAISNLVLFHEGSDHMLELLKVIRRAVATHHHILHKCSGSRLLPPGFASIDLKDIITWLNLQAVSSNTLVTTECCSLLTSLAPCFPGICDSKAMITHFTIQYFTERSLQAFSKMFDEIEGSDLNELLESFQVTCHISFFRWLIENSDAEFLSVKDWIFIKVVGSIMKKLMTISSNVNVPNYFLNIWDIRTNSKDRLPQEFVIIFLELLRTLENPKTSTAKALVLLNSYINVTSFLHVFLVEPSTLGVRFETSSYRSLNSHNLTRIGSSSESFHAFMFHLFGKLDQLLKDLVSKQLHQSQLELLHCVGFLNDVSLSTQRYGGRMKKMINSLSDALVCSNFRNNKLAYVLRNPLSKLLNFILSLGTFDEVTSELFNRIFSDPKKAVHFYDQFEHEIVKFIIVGINEQHWSCLGAIDCGVKMRIFKNILAKTHSWTMTNKFAVCLMKSFAMSWKNIVSPMKVDGDLYILLDCLHLISNATTTDCYRGTEIEVWIQALLQEDLSLHVGSLLVPYVDPTACEDFVAKHGGKEYVTLYILSHSLVVGHFKVVSFCLKNLSDSGPKLDEAYKLITSQFAYFDPVSKGLVLDQMFQHCLEEKTATIQFHHETLADLILLSPVSSQKSFFSDNISTITSTIFKELQPESGLVKHAELLINKSLCFRLIGSLYGAFDKNEISGLHGFIKWSDSKESDRRLDFIKSCYLLQSCRPLQAPGDSSYMESWRICQCAALNCLLVLMSSKLSSKALQHFVFQDRSAKIPFPVLENIINSIATPKFISWQEAKQMKRKKKKLVDTGIKVASRAVPTNFDCHTSYVDVSITSISQECKAFDFIRQSDVPALHDSSTVVEVELEGDTLNSHVCLPYLCSTITKTIECGITSCVGERMPEWMASFNALLRNPEASKNVKSLIVKIVEKCKDVFKPYAAHWALPILYSLVSLECCGAVTSHFFYQVTTMLVSWLPLLDQNQENSMISKLWNRLIVNIITGIVACVSDDVHHLLRIFRLIIENKSKISPPYAILMELSNKHSSHTLGVTLKLCCIFFECGLIPYTSDTEEIFLRSVKSAMTHKDICENAAVVIGHILKNASNSTLQQTYCNIVEEDLNKLDQSHSRGNLFMLLKNIYRNFSFMAEKYLPKALEHLNNPKLRTLHTDVMNIIESYISTCPNADVFFKLEMIKHLDAIKSSSYGVKLSGLNVLKSFIGCGNVDVVSSIVRYVMDHSSEFSSISLKTQIYEILVIGSAFLRSIEDSGTNLSLKVEEWLFKHLLEEGVTDLQEQLIRCITNDHIWKSDTRESVMKLLEALPNVSINRNIVTCFVNMLLFKSLKSYVQEDTMCDELTVGSDIEISLQSIEPVVVGSSLAPLFVETIQDGHCQIPTNDDVLYPSENQEFPSEELPHPSFYVHPVPNLTIKTTAREIKYLRVYGNKKLPDVRITFSEAISILQTMCKINKKISGTVFSSFFDSVLNKMLDDSLRKRLEALVPHLLNKLVNTSSPDTTFLLPFLDLCWKNAITLEPTLLYDVCELCKTREMGVLLAEQSVARFVPSLNSSVREPNQNITTDYNYLLSLFHEELGHMAISASFDEKTLSSATPSYGRSGGNEECMQTIFSQNAKFKELAMLNDWDQLNQVLGRPELIESSLDWENRCFKRFLNYRVLSEVNCKMLRNDPSFTCPMMELLEKRSKYRVVIQKELGGDLNMLYLVHNRLGDFKTMAALSVINRIYFLGLDRQVDAIHNDVVLKMSLDNYVMANCLGALDKSLFFNQLRIDKLYYPETPIQWHQIIINRNYFLTLVHETSEIAPEKPHILIRKSQRDYIKFLIRNGDLVVVKEFYSKFLKNSCYSYLENDFFETSMIHLLESQNHLDQQLKLDCLWKSWDSLTLVEGFKAKDVTVFLHFLTLCSEFVLYMPFAELDCERLRKALKGLSSNLEELPLSEAIIRCGHESISRAYECTNRKIMDDAFRITAEFCMKHLDEVSSELKRQLNETSVKCILKSLALGNSYGHHMLLKALNIVLNDIHIEQVFLNESLKIDVSSLEFWLPQLVGYLNCGKAKILEPLMMKLTEKCPQKLWLILHLYQSEQLNASLIVKKILKNLEPQMSGRMFVEALETVCHPNLLLKSYINRLMRAKLPEDILKVYNKIKERCFFDPHRGMMVGRIFMINDQYMDFIENIFEKKKSNYEFSDEETKMAIGTVEIQPLERYLQLESFSPLLSSFNCNTFKFEISHASCSEMNSCSNVVTLSSFSPNVSVIQSLRKPIKIEMLGSDGFSYPWIVKFDEDLRQDQYIQQLFSIINHSMKLRRDWSKENIITYKVVPFTPQYGIIEMVKSTLTMGSLINMASDDILTLRNSLKEEHSKWIYRSLVEAPREDCITAYSQAAKFYSAEDILTSFSTKSAKVPKDLLRPCILKYCDSPMEYFHRRINFLRSHAVLSLSHWVAGVGDRHLNNFLFSAETSELIGIDFGFSFGAGMECLPVPELVPFRLTPQFLNAYLPLYTSGIMEDVMVKSFSSIDKDILLLAMQVLVQLPLHNMQRNFHEYNTKGTTVDHARWIIDAVQKKLCMENPLDLINEHLSYGRLEQSTVDIYRTVLKRFSHFSKASSPKELVKMLIEMASDAILLGLSHHNFEPWI